MIEGCRSRVAAGVPGGRTRRRVQAGSDGSPGVERGRRNERIGMEAIFRRQSPSSRSSRCSAPARQPRPGWRSHRSRSIGFSQANGSDVWRTNQNKQGRRELQPGRADARHRTRTVTTQSSRATSTSSSARPVRRSAADAEYRGRASPPAAKRALDEGSRSSRSTAASMSRSPSTSAPTTSSSARPPRSTSAKTILGGAGWQGHRDPGHGRRLGDDRPPRRVRELADRQRPEGRDRRQPDRRLQA